MANGEENKNYRIITRDIAGKLTLHETYVFTWLLFKSDYETGESHVQRETLREVTGIKDVDTISKYTAKFEDLGFLRKEYNHRNNEGQLTTPVTYHVNIPKSNWIRFKKGLLLEDIPNELKAFLVLLKCLCINNTNITYYTKTEISRRLNLSPKTVKKYIDLAIEHGKPVEVNNFFLITDSNIILDTPRTSNSFGLKTFDKLAREKYDIIYNYCIEKNVVPPPYDYKLMEILCIHRYDQPETELEAAIKNGDKNAKKNYNYYSLKYNLPKLCPICQIKYIV
ncbi:hypothetical protein [uncultured Sanguibacteroides sp.]|uniref:hypothetical protein n=1 Tax=uncultured Sanguibacteroides sp. TaxID=1635151 RepID=UPI0025CDD547|nr:hypothetical protein [uncultured Sanguibacteroides sp.]